MDLEQQLAKMRSDWDTRARENAKYYVQTEKQDWTDEEFYASGRQTVDEEIATDMINICQGQDPSQMRVIEIGCGAGRVTSALADMFGEVHAVDVSAEMAAQARKALQSKPNAHVHHNNGMDLSVVPAGDGFDFAFSTIVFQHIPSQEIIENYLREVHRLLKPGRLFKFQVQGGEGMDPTDPGDTWEGVPFSDAEAVAMAQRCGFEPRYRHGAGTQYFWLWYFRNPDQPSTEVPAAG